MPGKIRGKNKTPTKVVGRPVLESDNVVFDRPDSFASYDLSLYYFDPSPKKTARPVKPPPLRVKFHISTATPETANLVVHYRSKPDEPHHSGRQYMRYSITTRDFAYPMDFRQDLIDAVTKIHERYHYEASGRPWIVSAIEVFPEHP